MICSYVFYRHRGVVAVCSAEAHDWPGSGVPLCWEHRAEITGRTYVYVLIVGNYAKIGYSTDPAARAKQVMRDATRRPADAVGVPVLLTYVPGNADTEKLLHRVFADLRVEGEWFRREGALERLLQELLAEVPPEPIFTDDRF